MRFSERPETTLDNKHPARPSPEGACPPRLRRYRSLHPHPQIPQKRFDFHPVRKREKLGFPSARPRVRPRSRALPQLAFWRTATHQTLRGELLLRQAVFPISNAMSHLAELYDQSQTLVLRLARPPCPNSES